MTDSSNDSTAIEPRSWRAWIVAFILTSLVTLAGFAVAMQQFIVKYVWDNWAHTRTLPGVLFFLLGALGLALPVLLILKRKWFATRHVSRQWLLAFGMPLIFVAAIALCIEASLRSTTMILPRADTPIAVVGYRNGGVQIDFRCRKGFPGIGGSDRSDNGDAVERFSANYEAAYSPRRGYSTSVVIRGQVERLENGMLHIDLDVDADEPIKFAVEDIEIEKMTLDGQPIDDSDSRSGKYRVTILAQHTPTARLSDRFTQAATHMARVEVLREIVALGPKVAARILEPIDAKQLMLAVDDQSLCVIHDNESGVLHWISPYKRNGSSTTGGLELAEVRWLGWADARTFGLPSQPYSVFAGKHASSDDYSIIFVAFREGKGSGINVVELQEDHYQTLGRFGLWPEDWPREAASDQDAKEGSWAFTTEARRPLDRLERNWGVRNGLSV